MDATFLGTGTSQGIPVIACPCRVCNSPDSYDKRLRTSLHIRHGATSVVIDAGPDFRQQMLNSEINRLDAVVITHGHKDHTGGLDDVRAYNWIQKKPMDIYARPSVIDIVKREFPYAFGIDKYPGAPQINLLEVPEVSFPIGELTLLPIEAMHGPLPVVGFRVGAISYLTDASQIEQDELNKMKGSTYVIINALRQEKHHSHFTLSEAIDIIQFLQPDKGFITHISHQMGLHQEIQKKLPENIVLAYDGMKISC